MKLTRRTWIRAISYIIAAIVAGSCFMIVMMGEIRGLKTRAEYNYSMHLNELDGSIYNISLALKKAMYASSATQFSTLAAELCAESTVAKNSLSQLPSAENELATVNRFLSQVGDYTLYLSKKVISGGDISDEERENLHSMALTAGTLSTSVGEVRSEYDKEGVWSEQLASGISATVDTSFGENLLELEELLSDYPSLIYDGPFSDHMLSGSSKMLENLSEITPEEAAEKAAETLKIDVEKLEKGADTLGKMPCYTFNFEETMISISKQGGYIVNMRKYTEIGEQTIDYEKAVEIANEYINSFSGTNFVTTYYFADEGVCTVNFAHKEGATICYPDLVKVGVSLGDGEIVFIEAAGYLANHYLRSISTPKYSAAEAKEVLSKALKVLSVRRAIIPTDGNSEKHCYEFTCEGLDGEELLVYVNVMNLEEERILMLLKTDGGTLAK